ncbi:MAG: glutathione S-transferase [Betaproteobacteria bacterium]|nr:glutathione S-transferase [Betaproteobacteria bacterium]
MKLIGSLTSPFVRKVRIVLAEKKIDYEFAVDSPWEDGTKVSQSNPLSKVPVLVLDDETPIFDSRVIVEYLDSAAPNNKLLPATGRARTEVRCWEALSDGICDAASLILLEQKRPPEQQSASWIQRQREKVDGGLAFMANGLKEEHSHCVGTHFSLADAAVGSTLGWLLLRFPEIEWQTEYPALARLYDRLMQRPSFVETQPPKA